MRDISVLTWDTFQHFHMFDCSPLLRWLTHIFAAAAAVISGVGSDRPHPISSESDPRSQRSVNKQVEAALDSYGNSILRIAYSYLKNMADAEDILQDTLLQLLRRAPEFSSAEHEKAWLLRVAINLCKNRLKYNQVRRTEELSEALTCAVPEDLSFVWDTVSELPLHYREVIHLFYHEDYSTAQIASLLEKRESTVRSLLFRARGILKQRLKEAYDFE